jgi:hypothetical protein
VVPCCGAMVYTGTVGMGKSVGVFSGGGSMVVMGTIRVTTLHPRGPGKPELHPLPEAILPLLEDSTRMVFKDNGLLCTIPTNMVLESFPREKDSGC